MKLKFQYESANDIPEQYKELYTEKEGKFVLTGVDLPPSKEEDVARLSEALRKEKSDHASTKEKLKSFDGIDATSVHSQLDELEELRLKVDKNQVDDEKIEKIVEARVARKLAPVERERNSLQSKLKEIEAENSDLKGSITKGKILSTISKAAQEAKLVPSAMEDVKMYSGLFDINEKDEVVLKDTGLAVDVWLQDMKDKRPHWWETSRGGGAAGGGSGAGIQNNPWRKDSWNLTEQGKIMRESGIEKAKQLASLAGVDVNATGPKG